MRGRRSSASELVGRVAEVKADHIVDIIADEETNQAETRAAALCGAFNSMPIEANMQRRMPAQVSVSKDQHTPALDSDPSVAALNSGNSNCHE
jgi:hypothetical protein